MGNPNNRRKNVALPLVVETNNRLSISGNDGANSPKTPPGRDKMSEVRVMNNKEVSGSQEKYKKRDKGKGKEVDVASHSSIIAPKPIRPLKALAFKSYKTGSLITENFEPTLPTPLSPFPPPKSSPLNPTSPAFVPAPPRVPAPALHESTKRRQSSDSVQKLQALIYNMSSRSPSTNQQHQLQGAPPMPLQQFHPGRAPPTAPRAHNAYPHRGHNPIQPPKRYHRAPATSLSQIMQRYPTPPLLEIAALPPRAPTTFLAKRDKSRKDIVLSDKGVKRNIARITERYLPNGAPYQTMSSEFNEGTYDFMKELEKMNEVEKHDFLSKSCVEIHLSLMSQEDEEAEMAAKTAAKKLPVIEEEGSTTSSTSGSGVASVSSTKTPTIKTTKEIPAIIKVLQSLPQHFVNSTEKLTITLQFPQLPNSPFKFLFTPTGPRAAPPSRTILTRGNSTHGVSVDTSYQEAPNFTMMVKVVDEVFKFKNLKKLDVVIAPPSNMRTPMTLPQLNCVLPFYDLEFTDWKIWWQAPFMSRPETLRSWPLDYLNKERDRICYERAEKLRNLVFVTKSIAPALPVPLESRGRRAARRF